MSPSQQFHNPPDNPDDAEDLTVALQIEFAFRKLARLEQYDLHTGDEEAIEQLAIHLRSERLQLRRKRINRDEAWQIVRALTHDPEARLWQMIVGNNWPASSP